MALTAGRVEAFNNDPFAVGLDLKRCVVAGPSLGVWDADSAATIRQGDLVTRGTTGKITTALGVNVMGVSKWTQASTHLGVVVDEPVTLVGTTASTLKHANVSNARVQTATGGGGSTVAASGNYTLNTTNGTLARLSGSSIADGATVYITYTYQLSEADLDFQGRNWFNSLNDVTLAAGKVTVIQGASHLYTTRYDTSVVYAINDILFSLGATTAGLAGLIGRSNSGSGTGDGGQRCGVCTQVPTAADPFLGIEFQGFQTRATF